MLHMMLAMQKGWILLHTLLEGNLALLSSTWTRPVKHVMQILERERTSLGSLGSTGKRYSMSGSSMPCPPRMRMLLASEALLPGTYQTARTGMAESASGQGLSSCSRVAWIGVTGGGSPALSKKHPNMIRKWHTHWSLLTLNISNLTAAAWHMKMKTMQGTKGL